MDVRTKLIELLESAESAIYWNSSDEGFIQKIADHLIANGVTITPAVPGPSEDDPNIMELCFRNGERHMKEKVLTKLKDFSAEVMFEERISGEVTVVNFEYVIRILEDL